MTRDQMLGRASHIFIGVIEKQELEHWLFLRVPGDNSGYWKVLRGRVRMEMVLRGVERRKTIDIYEFFWTGGTHGDWNSTQDDTRYLFLTRVENGGYHVVRDWWRSIFPIYGGKHDRLPLDDSHPFWERIGLANWWLSGGHSSYIRLEWTPAGRSAGGGRRNWRAASSAIPNARLASSVAKSCSS